MSFDEILGLLENAEDYLDLYDAASFVEDDELRAKINNIIDVCSEDNKDLPIIIKRICNLLEVDEDVEDKTLDAFIEELNDASNDKDLLNIIDDMEHTKNIDDELVVAIRQLFRNNRYMALNDKVNAILRLIQSQDESVTIEPLTESVDSEKVEDENDIKEDETIDEKVADADNEEVEATTEMLKLLKDRVGQQYSVGELNSVIQSLFGQYNKVFLLSSDLYNKDLDTTQTIEVIDDEYTYVLSYDIIDMDSGIVELVDVTLKG